MKVDKFEELIANDSNVGVISNFFSKQFLNRYLNVFELPTINFKEYIEVNDIKIVFLDNDLYEVDHKWYQKKLNGLLSYLNLNNITVCVIKNSNVVLKNMYRDYTIINFISGKDNQREYSYGKEINISPIVDERLFNPINDYNKRDYLYLTAGKLSRTKGIQIFQEKLEPSRKEISIVKFSKENTRDLIEEIKKSKFLYIYNPEEFDSTYLYFIEIISILQHTVVLYDSENIKSEYALNNKEIINLNNMGIIIEDSVYTDKLIIPKQREVFLKNTFIKYPSLDTLFKKKSDKVCVSVITSTNRRDYLDRYVNQMNKQNGVKLQVICILHGIKLSRKEREHFLNNSNFDLLFIEIDNSKSLGYCLNTAIYKAQYQFIAKMDDDDFYFENYLLDAWIAKKYSMADLVGKHSTYTYLKSSNVVLWNNTSNRRKYQNFVMGATFFCDKSLISKYMFSNLLTGEDSDFLRRVNEDNNKIFTDHPYNFCIFRSDNTEIHTWKRLDIEFFRNAKIEHYGKPDTIVSI